ncbi:MAG: RidA family protein [Candidatus Binataceae bacterium]
MGQLARFASGAPWEPIVAYSRAVRAGDFVAVSGTTAFDERGLIVGAGQMYVQARQALANIQRALEKAGLSMRDVVRTRMYVTDISGFADAARAHHEFFADSPPATSMVEVRRLVHPTMLIEIEADAYASSAGAAQPAHKPAAKPSIKAKPKAAVKKRPTPKPKKRK